VIGTGILITAATALGALVAVVCAAWLLHAAWSTAKARRLAALRPAVLQALATAIRDGDSTPALAALATLNSSGRIGAVVDMAFTVAGDQRARLNALVRNTGIWGGAVAWARSRRWSRRLRAARLFALFGSGSEDQGDRLLGDPRPDVRAQASEWAGEHPTRRRADRLVEMLEDPDPRCRFAAREGLVQSGRTAIPSIRERLDAADGAASLDLFAVATILSVPEFGDRAVELCRASDPATRASAAILAGAIGGAQAVAALAGLLEDPDERVRAAAVAGLGSLGHWQEAGRVAGLLEDESWTVRRGAALALGRMGPTGTLLLNRAAREGSPAAADTASYALGLSQALMGAA
jgi:HEAT repeat protein